MRQSIISDLGITLLDIHDKLNPIPDASYRRDRKKSPPNSTCLPGTREAVIKQVKSWVNDAPVLKDPSNVLWLYGYIGSGKSAIAQTIAETFAKKGRLAASFFFFRGSGDRSKSDRFIRTLASDLASSIPSTVPSMKKAIKDYVGLLTASPIELQFQHLFLDPFRSSLRNPGRFAQSLLTGPVVTVVDGLDECEDRGAVASFMDRIVQFYQDHPRTPLRFFISSRVEEYIRTRIAQIKAPTTVDLAHHGSEEDITVIVHETFKRAAEDDRIIRSYGAWPALDERRKLVQLADGSFIMISTVLRLILERTNDGRSAKDRLGAALSLRTGLDEVYAAILAPTEDLPYFIVIISTVILARTPLTIVQLAGLHHLTEADIILVLENLHSVLQIPPEDDKDPVTLCHSSFREFLCAKSRSGRLCISPSFHKTLAYRCFEHLHKDTTVKGYPTPVDYAANAFLWHWTSYLSLHVADPPLVKQEVEDIIAHFRATHPKSIPFVNSLFITYTLLDRGWLSSTSGKHGKCSVAEFIQRLTAVRDKARLRMVTEKVIDAVEHAFATLPDPTSREEQFSVVLRSLDPPLSSLSQALRHHTLLVKCCIPQLFTRVRRKGAHVLFLPVHGEAVDDLYVADYAFRSFPLHLAMATEHDAHFAQQVLSCENKSWDSKATRRELTPFEYFVHQRRYYTTFNDPGEYLQSLKRSFELAASAVEDLLKVRHALRDRCYRPWR